MNEVSDEALKKVLKIMGQEATPEAIARLRQQNARSNGRLGSTTIQTFQNIALDELMEKSDFEYATSPGARPASVTSAGETQADALIFAPNGPTMNDALIQTLDLKPLEVAEVNKLIQVVRRDYESLEKKNLTIVHDKQGHVHVSLSSFATEWSALRARLLQSIEPILTPRSRSLMERHFPFQQLMPYGPRPVRAELWQDSKTGTYYYQGKPIPEIGVLSGGSGSHLPVLPPEYQYLWELAIAQ